MARTNSTDPAPGAPPRPVTGAAQGVPDLPPLPVLPGRDLSEILERVSDAFVALDSGWRYTYVNQRAADLFGRRPGDLLGKHIWTEFPEGVGQPFHLAYERAMADQVFIQMENYYEPWDRWFENRIYPSPGGLSIFFHEITERKRAEHAARASAQLLEDQNHVLECIAAGAPLRETLELLVRSIEAQSPGLICSILLLDPDGVHMRHGAAPSLPAAFTLAIDGAPIGPQAGSCGTAAFRVEAVVVEDIATDPLWEGYRDLALGHGLRACWSTPICDAGRRVLGTFALYFRAPCRPTERHWQLIDMSTHTAAIAIAKHRETQALRASEERLRLAVTGASIGIWEWDAHTDRVVWSDQLKAMFGWPADRQDLTLRMALDSVHPDDRAPVEATLRRSLELHTDSDVEFRIVWPDGTQRWLSSRGRGEYDASGRPVRMIGVALDVTERKRAVDDLEQRVALRTLELRARNEELKAFAYTVSHDLKAPLRGIAGYARELDRRHRAGLGDRALTCLKQILVATENLDRLIEDLLHYSRLDAAKPVSAEVDLARVVESILKDRKPVLQEHGADVTVALRTASVRTWERGLVQVLTNLIDNAVKYSRSARPPRIHIASEPLPHAIRITVSDNGIGFDMKYHDRIFGLFNRLVRQDEFEGTGAGLAIVKKLLEKLGGTIRAESKPGAGATFFVELPWAGTTAEARR